QLQQILLPGEDWKLVADGYNFVAGLAVNSKGEVVYNDISARRAYKVGLDGKVSQSGAGLGGSQAFGPDGRLLGVYFQEKKVLAHGEGKPATIAEGIAGSDLVVSHNGGVYLTGFVLRPGREAALWYVNPRGEKRDVDEELQHSGGVTLSPDQTLLYVSDSQSHWVYSYQVQEDGSLAHKQRYYHLHVPDNADDSGARGMRVDRDGRLYVATRMGIQVCDQAGRVNCIIPTPNGKLSNLCFGGENFDTLYATCGDKVFKRKVKVKGAQAWQPPLKPAAPRL